MPTMTLVEAEQLGVEFSRIGAKSLAEARAMDAQYIEDKFIEGDYFWGAVIEFFDTIQMEEGDVSEKDAFLVKINLDELRK